MHPSEFFRSIVKAGWQGLEDWVETQEPETLHLEFKQKARGDASWNDEDQDALATAMSAFANTEGGVLVFGVQARGQNKGLPDLAQSILPIERILRFAGKIELCVQKLTDPPIGGIQIKPIPKPDDPDKGAVVIYIPASDSGPHRVAKGLAEHLDRYYMRTSAGSINMHHSLLASMFGRQPNASLYLKFDIEASRNIRNVYLSIGNHGRGYADRPAIRLFQYDPSYDGIMPGQDLEWYRFAADPRWNGIPMNNHPGNGCLITSTSGVIVYPGMELPIGYLMNTGSGFAYNLFKFYPHGAVYALNMQPAKFSLIKDISIGTRSSGELKESFHVPLGHQQDVLGLPK